MINVSDQIVEEIKTYILYRIIFFNLAVYEMTWTNIVELFRPQMTIWRMRVACWTAKATHVHNM